MQGLWSYISKTGGQGPGKGFQYDIGDLIVTEKKSPWNLHNGKRRGTGELVSIFACDAKCVSPDEFQLSKMSHKRLKTLRHPNIIKYLDGFESESVVYVVTEYVKPLALVLQENDTKDNNLITWGIHQITIGLSFLINDCNLIHGNINIFSIFVGVDGEWKLGGLEYVYPSNNDSVAKMSSLTRYDPPEGALNKRKQEVWSVDAWGLGCLLWEIYNQPLQNSSELKDVSKIPKPVLVHYCELVSANPKSRTNPKHFLSSAKKPGKFLDNPFIKANMFLQEIQLKDIEEQKKFFNSLDKTIDGFPKEFCIHKMLPQLLNAFEYGTAGSSVLSPLFKIGLLLDDSLYEKKILPCIIKLFSSNDRSTRIHLLQQMEKFVKHLQPAVVNNQIFPCVASGFGDTLPAMREQTVKAMLLLAPKLTDKTLDQLLRHFAKLQMDEQPGIRTNTTICLGKIAQHLPEHTRKKVLIPAFVRALRDPFPPARSAGVMAIYTTQQYYDLREVAARVLPSLSPLTTDKEKMVRDNVFKVIKSLLKNLEDFSTNPESPLNNEEAAEKEANAQGGSTWTGWAVTSLTSRFYQSSSSDQQPKQGNINTEPPPNANTATPSNIPESRKLSGHAKPSATRDNTQQQNKTESRQKDSGDWDNDFGDDDDDDFQSLESIKDDLMSVRKEVSNFQASDMGNKSDSDYDDWQNDTWTNETNEKYNNTAWNKMISGSTESKEKKSTQSKQTVSSSLSSSKKNDTKKSSNDWDDWGVTDDKDQGDWSIGDKKSGDGWNDMNEGGGWNEAKSDDWSNPKSGNGWGDDNAISGGGGWDDDWAADEEEDKEKKQKERRKQELLKKREERRAQRELNNKTKRAEKSTSSGGMKLGVKKN